MVEKLLRCTRCNKVIPQFDRFGDFGEASLLPGVEWASEDLEEQNEFFKSHQGHLLEELTIDPETFISDKPSYEPIKVAYVEASNGKEKFLIKRTRRSFDRPAFYDLIPGKIRFSDVAVEIQEEDLWREVSWLNGSFPLSLDKMKKFIEAFREEVKSISPERVTKEVENTLPGETSLLAYGSFSEARWGKVLHRCEKEFQESELKLIERFIRNNRQPDEVLGLQIKKTIAITQ